LQRDRKEKIFRVFRSAAHLRLAGVYVECPPYGDFIRRYDREETFFYIDPPYWNRENYYGKGIFSRDDFGKLSEQLAGIRGRFIMSLSDTPETREVFASFEMETVETCYTRANSKSKKAVELLISN
jgi:DNA adenine methylase